MAGGIYTEEKCPLCGQGMKPDPNLECVCCPNPKHKKQPQCRTRLVFIKFGKDFKKRFSSDDPVTSYRLAHQELESMRRAVGRGTFDRRDYEPSHPLGFSTLAQKYIEDREKDISNPLEEEFRISRQTWIHLRSDMSRCMEAFGQTNVKELGYDQLRDFFRDMQTKPNPRAKSPVLIPAKSKTKKNVRTNLRAFYNWMVKTKVIKPSEIPEIPSFKVVMEFRARITWEQQEAVLHWVRERSTEIGEPKIYLGIKLCMNTPNIRPGDLAHVLEKDVVPTTRDSQRFGVVTINSHKTIEHTQAPKYGIFTPEDMGILDSIPKGFPSLPFFRWTSPEGRRCKGERVNQYGTWKKTERAKYNRWRAPAGTPYGPDLFRDWFKRACDALGYEGVGLYGGTRHSTTRILKDIIGRDNTQHLNGDRTNEAFSRYLEENVEELMEAAMLREVAGKVRRPKILSGPLADHRIRTAPPANH